MAKKATNKKLKLEDFEKATGKIYQAEAARIGKELGPILEKLTSLKIPMSDLYLLRRVLQKINAGKLIGIIENSFQDDVDDPKIPLLFRSQPITCLGIHEFVIKYLHNHGIYYIGELGKIEWEKTEDQWILQSHLLFALHSSYLFDHQIEGIIYEDHERRIQRLQYDLERACIPNILMKRFSITEKEKITLGTLFHPHIKCTLSEIKMIHEIVLERTNSGALHGGMVFSGIDLANNRGNH